MDCNAENRTQPAINFTHVADKFLLANGTMAAFRNKLEMQKACENCNGMTSHHGTRSHSSQYSDEGYGTNGVESEHEVDIKEGACHAVDEHWSGYVSNGLNSSSFEFTENKPLQILSTDENNSDSERILQSNGEQLLTLKHESKKASCKTNRPKSRVSRPPLLPPCRVCGDRASGFHYGVNTCEACKGFFRRSINKTSEPYTCVGNGRCKLVPGKRTACSACRYQRCLEVGMSKSAIKTGRYTHELRSKNIMEVKKLQLQKSMEAPFETTGVTMETEDSLDMPPSVEDRDSENLLQTLMDGQRNLYEFLDDYYNEELMLSRQLAVYQRYMKSKGKSNVNVSTPSFNTNRTTEESVKLRVLQHPIKLDIVTRSETDTFKTTTDIQHGFRHGEIDKSVRAGGRQENDSYRNPVLMKGANFDHCSSGSRFSVSSRIVSRTDLNSEGEENSNISDVVSETLDEDERQSVEQTDELKKAEVLSQVLKDMERGVQGMLSFSRCLPGFEDLPKEDQASMLKAARFDIWYIGHIRCFNTDLLVGACEWQFHAEEMSKVWGSEIVELVFRLSRVGQTLNLTKEEVASLRAVCLTFPDRCYPLTERSKVEAIHSHMLELFHYVSKKRHRNFNNWFAKVVHFLTILREFGIAFEKASSCLKLDWSVLQENPYLLEVFLS